MFYQVSLCFAGVGGLDWVNSYSSIAMDALLSTLIVGIGEVEAPYAPWSFTPRWDYTHLGYWAFSRYSKTLQLMLDLEPYNILYYTLHGSPAEHREIGKWGGKPNTQISCIKQTHTYTQFKIFSCPTLLLYGSTLHWPCTHCWFSPDAHCCQQKVVSPSALGCANEHYFWVAISSTANVFHFFQT